MPDSLVTFVSMFESPGALDGLNDEQRRAAAHPAGPLLILAGAGTGKTRTLVARAAWLCEQGVQPHRILLLTFTRRAAEDMLSRAAGRDRPAAGRITGGTFHAIAHRIIRQHAESFSLPPRFTVLDPGDTADLLDARRADHGLAGTQRRGVRGHLHPLRERAEDGHRGGARRVPLVRRVRQPARRAVRRLRRA